MTDGHPNITVCADCGTELVHVEANDERPIQCVTRRCPSCDEQVPIGLCRYPGPAYDAVGELPTETTENCDRCGDQAAIIVVDLDEQEGLYCRACARSHHIRTIDECLDY